MAKLPILVSALLVVCTPAYAQVIQGVVMEDSTHTPIPGATVQLLAAKSEVVLLTILSDSTGQFELRPGSPGAFTVRTSHPSYRSTVTHAVNLRGGEIIRVELRMSRTAIPLEPLVVRARGNARLAGFYERARRSAGFGYFITREQIESRGAVHQTTDLLRNIPSIDIVPVKRGLSAPNVLLIRGRGGCQPAIYLDGLPMAQSTDGGVDDFLKPEMIEGVEIYTSSVAVPSEFNRPGMCGAVAFWTKPPEENGLGKFAWVKLFGGVGAVLLLILLTK